MATRASASAAVYSSPSDEDAIPVTARLVSRPSARSIEGGPISVVLRQPGSSERLRVVDLLEEHAAAIDSLRASVCNDPLYRPARHDGLFLLRFVLSHAAKGGAAAAAAAVRATLRYRDEFDMDADGYDATPAAWEAMRLFYSAVGQGGITYYAPDPDRSLLLVVVIQEINFHQLASSQTPTQTALGARCSSEWLFRHCDAVTRRTGYLTKYARLIDLRGLKLSAMNREFQRRDREISKALEDFYPQLLGAAFMCHGPGWLQSLWRGMRPLLPARFAEKVDFVNPAANAAERGRLLRLCRAAHGATTGSCGLSGAICARGPACRRHA